MFVRAFDSDERLVGVAFMDVGVYVTSLRTMKNLLLVGDAVKSVMFVAFQVRLMSDHLFMFLTRLAVIIGGSIQARTGIERHEGMLGYLC